MSNKPQFDVFLSHNSQDKAIVRKIANELRQRGIEPWFDDEQIPAGQPILDFIEKAIQNVKSIAVFIGSEKLGMWQKRELISLIGVGENIPIIPVLLPGVDDIPKDLPFLKDRISISFTQSGDERAIDLLVRGITGQKPNLLKLPSVKQQKDNLDG
jgi:hypothetical protein